MRKCDVLHESHLPLHSSQLDVREGGCLDWEMVFQIWTSLCIFINKRYSSWGGFFLMG